MSPSDSEIPKKKKSLVNSLNRLHYLNNMNMYEVLSFK